MDLMRRLYWGAAAVSLVLLAWGALAPLDYPTRERAIEFSRGAVAPVPPSVLLTLGVRDVLLLRNRDLRAHVFGQVRVLPGREFRLPFEQAGEFPFACDGAPGARVLVRVLPRPDPGWERLCWRLRVLADAVRGMPLQGPDD